MLLLALMTAPASANTVVNSKHNLSVSGPGTVKAKTQTDVCIFCHAAHKTTGETPLWSHALSAVTNYVIYSSPTLKATVGQPDGSSRLCLSCHDGTVALGMVSSRTTTIEMQSGITALPTGPSNLGTDLSGDHPISFVYDQNLATLDTHLRDPLTLDRKLKLDHLQKVQCVTCHDPHDDQFGKFLVMDNTASTLCLGCHVEPGWAGSAHGGSSAQLIPPSGTSPSPAGKLAPSRPGGIAANACENCHTSHKAGSKARLLIRPKEEQNCFACHNGQVVVRDLTAEFNKPSAHPVLQTSATHNLAEDPINSPRHAACADCHNPHAVPPARDQSAASRTASGQLAGVKGVNSAGAVTDPVAREFELCFRCHADSLNRGPARLTRQVAETNKRLQFQASNQSFHPLETTGKNANVPSLITPWTTSSLMDCTDCHNNDQSVKTGGTGPNGPHGSVFTPILERQLLLTDGTPENAGNYALCYKCHSRDSILSDQSFKALNAQGEDRGHRFHIVDPKVQAACTTCHDSHGVATASHLINFNLFYVSPPSMNGTNGPAPQIIQYSTTGTFSGTCTLSCHGKDHVGTSYPLPAPAVPSALKLRRR